MSTSFIELQGVNGNIQEEENVQDTHPLLREPPKVDGFFQTLKADLTVAAKYVINDSLRHKKGFAIGVFTVFLVVMIMSVLQNAVNKSPIIFLKLSEDQVGEYDLLMTPIQNVFINFTEASELLGGIPVVEGLAPRWLAIGRLLQPDKPLINSTVAILAIESDHEKQIGLGRSWSHRALGPDEIHVTGSVLRRLGVLPDVNAKLSLVIDLIGLADNLGGDGQSPKALLYAYISNATGLDLTKPISDINITQQIVDVIGPYVNITQYLDAILGPQGYNLTKGELYPQFIFNHLYDILHQNMIVNRQMTVVDAIEEPQGKYPKALGNVAIMESSFLQELVVNAIHNFTANVRANLTGLIDLATDILEPLGIIIPGNISQIVNQVLDTIDQFGDTISLNDYAQMVIVMNRNRVQEYTLADADLKQAMVDFTNNIADGLGVNFPAEFSLPIYSTLQVFKWTKLSVDQIFNCVIFVMLLLGGMLIYSLMLNDVESKTYEYGMLRSLGMRQYVLVELLLIQAVSFSIPGILVGLLFGWLAYLILAAIVAHFVFLPIDISFAPVAIITSVLLGFLMPIASNIFPIRRALSRTLKDALDIYHQVRSETSVRVQKLENLGLDPWQICLSFATVVIGFVVYYVVPYAFTYQNYGLFFAVMSGILVGMLLGMSLIALTLQPYLEKLALWAIMWGADKLTLHTLTRKNLFSHASRNMKTAMMFTICLTFVIFAGTVFRLQGHNITELIQLGIGSDILLRSSSINNPLPEADLRAYLEADMATNPNTVVTGFTFLTFQLQNNKEVNRARMSNLAAYPEFTVHIIGVEENFLLETFTRFFYPSEVDNEFKYDSLPDSSYGDVVKSLYVNAGQARLPIEQGGIRIPSEIVPEDTIEWRVNNLTHFSNAETYTHYVDVIVSEAMRISASVDVHTPMRLRLALTDDSSNNAYSVIFLAKPRALVSRVPAFFFSSYSLTAGSSPVLVSMNTYNFLLGRAAQSRGMPIPKDAPVKQILLVKTTPSSTVLDREGVINGLRNYIDDDTIIITNTLDLLNSTEVAVNILDMFFYTVAILSITLCFFVLWLSFTANVNENSWEFGVLRSIGLTAFKIIRMYVYEAMSIIIASVVTGSSIGILASISLTVQFNLFTELPFWFEFPYLLFGTVIVMSVVIAVVGSYIPARSYKQKSISAVLKGQ